MNKPRLLGCGRQAGTALIMALVILVILTLLGVTVMGNVSLEAKMAGNAQETQRALQFAESGLEHTFNSTDSYPIELGKTLTTASPIVFDGGEAVVATTYHTQSNIPLRANSVENIYSNRDYTTANFEQESTGTTRAGARAVVKQGARQIVHR